MTHPDEVLEAFARRKAERHMSEADKRRNNAELIQVIEQRIPEAVEALSKNGYQEYDDKRFRAQEVTVNGRPAIIWSQEIPGTTRGLGFYVDTTKRPRRGVIVITDDVEGGEYRTATENELLDLRFETLNATARGLLVVLKKAESEPGYILHDEQGPNPAWERMKIHYPT